MNTAVKQENSRSERGGFLVFMVLPDKAPNQSPVQLRPVSTLAEQRRSHLKQIRREAMSELLRCQPGLQSVIASASGFAVFTDIRVNTGAASQQTGRGILRDNRKYRDLFMTMLSGGNGWGIGVRNLHLVIVFLTDEAIQQFITLGRIQSGQEDVKIHHLTESGLILQATLLGTHFQLDDQLNDTGCEA